MLANLLAFTGAYFSESRLFSGLQPDSNKKFSGFQSQVAFEAARPFSPPVHGESRRDVSIRLLGKTLVLLPVFVKSLLSMRWRGMVMAGGPGPSFPPGAGAGGG